MSFIFLFFLFRHVKRIKNNEIRIVNYVILSLITFLFIMGTLWNDIWITEKNERNSWITLSIHVNQSGTKILRQLRETSGSIYDYRERLVIYEFDNQNRISINVNKQNFKGPWRIEYMTDHNN